jgi:hypothetical protein
MARKQVKVIVNCAATGSIYVPSQSEYLPITPEKIAEEAILAAKEGRPQSTFTYGILKRESNHGFGAFS